MNEYPLGVRQSAPDALLHVSHFTRVKPTQSKFESVFMPSPKGTPPDVGVRWGCVSVS